MEEYARQGLATLAMCVGVLLLGLPLVNGLVTGHWPWVSVSSGLWPVLGVDLAATLCGLTGEPMVSLLLRTLYDT